MKVNYLAVVAAALSSFVLGGLWYGPLFLGIWQQEAGVTAEQMEAGNPVVMFGGAFVLALVAAYGMAIAVRAVGSADALAGFRDGLLVGLFFAATALGINYLFAQHTAALWAIDAGYAVLMFGLMGAILAAWPGKGTESA